MERFLNLDQSLGSLGFNNRVIKALNLYQANPAMVSKNTIKKLTTEADQYMSQRKTYDKVFRVIPNYIGMM